MSVDKIKRSLFAQFLNTAPSATSETWSRMGKGITSGTIDYGATVTTETYIHEDTASSSVDAYSVQLGVQQTAIKGDPIFDFVDGLRRSRAIGSALETDLLIVYLYTGTGTQSITYEAEKQPVTIQIENFGGEGGGNNEINYTLLSNGDAEIGTATIASGVPTFTPAS